MQGDEADHELHIAMLPWLAFGHINPFLSLSMSLITSTTRRHRRIRVSFLSTPRNLARLPPIPPHLSSLLQLVPLSMPTIVEGLPPTAEATMDIPDDKIGHLMLAADQLAGPVSAFLDADAPDVIIHDFFFSWVPPLARRRSVPTVFFSVFSAASIAYVGPPAMGDAAATWPASPADLTSPAPWITFPTSVTFRPHEAKGFYQILFLPNSTGVSNATRVHAVITGASAVAVRTCTELEPDFLQLLPKLYNKPTLPVGVLRPDNGVGIGGGGSGGGSEMEWLDGRPGGSTVYAAFGSEPKLGQEHVTELAMGLEMSGLPFIWAFRDGLGSLPVGFEERVSGRGMVLRRWAPQQSILAHQAVGGFLTHCGISSLVESVGQGKPLVGVPIMGDEGLNCRAMVERGFCMEVPRDEISGSFTRDDVARALRLVLVEEAGGPIRAKALEMKDVFSSKDWNQVHVDKFVHFLEEDLLVQGIEGQDGE